ncbi:MAG TPA: NTP transferase domain-containing protein [Methanospirillum sp.]|uniref:NTP transferase domain-containing protein n=1 Tax=Methanospirillum sp. TaxID=45200 RepID=UPI002C38489D|nr:NTP transferase domain-containing protein [Methanospirillum sp.]HOJ95478.1 NTP transferase domain-containing protein [Methanospirillum sp.]HOL40494.1 NTP transferase domain-containing protein [Methanospirillum sp.]HPP78467.1 NTP transferase domain-containing protein [Methanospirillum sp.]
MFALIMAGGRASRLGMGEKALARVHDKPLISYVLDAVQGADLEPVVIVSPLTPYTLNYCRIHDILWVCTDGNGYVEDIGQAVRELDITGPFLTICADLPGITVDHIKTVLKIYANAECPACSVWVPCEKPGSGTLPGIPVGMNILTGSMIEEEQKEIQIMIEDPLLTLNINTREDLNAAEQVLSKNTKKV